MAMIPEHAVDGAAEGRMLDLKPGRRGFMGALALGAAGAMMFDPSDLKAAGPTDADILNFALNLEYLEAEFYVRAAFGRGLFDFDVNGSIGTLGAVSGGRMVDFGSDTLVYQYAKEIASDEENHVKFLRSAVGGPAGAISRPAIDFNQSFTALARLAGLIGPTDTFDPFANPTNFLLGAFIFEDVGVTAYKGAAPLIQSKGVLEAAAGLLAVEAYHAGLVRTVLYSRGLFDQTQAISNLRDSFNGSEKDQGVGDTIVYGTTSYTTASNIVPTDGQSLAFSRNTTEVINIVYATIQTPPQPGGFFPAGLNGAIR